MGENKRRQGTQHPNDGRVKHPAAGDAPVKVLRPGQQRAWIEEPKNLGRLDGGTACHSLNATLRCFKKYSPEVMDIRRLIETLTYFSH